MALHTGRWLRREPEDGGDLEGGGGSPGGAVLRVAGGQFGEQSGGAKVSGRLCVGVRDEPFHPLRPPSPEKY